METSKELKYNEEVQQGRCCVQTKRRRKQLSEEVEQGRGVWKEPSASSKFVGKRRRN